MIQRWRKKARSGRHTFSFQGKRISALPNDIVECTAEALGAAIRKYDCLGPLPGQSEVKSEQESAASKQLVLTPTKRSGFYNIINPDNPDKPLNSKPLRKIEAETALDQMLLEIAVSTDEDIPPVDLDEMDWDALVAVMESRGLEVLDSYETVDDLRDAIRAELVK